MRPSSTIHRRYSLIARRASLSPGLGLALTLAAGLFVAPAAVEARSLTLFDAPAWAHYFCDSSESDPNGSVAAIQGTHCYPSLTVPSGAVVQLTNLDASTVAAPDAPRGEWLVYVDGPQLVLPRLHELAFPFQNGIGKIRILSGLLPVCRSEIR